MAQDITLLGASYQAVPAVTLPKTGGGTASFTDVTDTTAAAADVATGKYFYSAAGVRTEGTSSGGGGNDYLAQKCMGALTSYSSNDVTSLYEYSFYYSPLQTLNIPNCKYFGPWAVSHTSLTTLVLPSIIKMGWKNSYNGTGIYGCRENTQLATVDAGPNLNQIGNNFFYGCTSLSTLIIRSSTLVTLSDTQSFNNTCFWSGKSGGTIYIPKTLYDHLGDGTSSDYQSATNWSTIYGYGKTTFAQIEGSAYENAYADGTPIS